MAGSLQSHHLCVFHCHISQTPRQLQKRQINSRNAFSTLGNSIFGRVPFFIILKYHNEILCHHPNTSWSSPVNTTPPPSSESTDSLLSISADVHGVIVRSMKSVDHKKDHHKHHLGFHTKTTWKWYAWIHVHVMSPHVTDIMFRQQVQLSQEKYVSIFCSDGSQKVTSATGQKLSLFGTLMLIFHSIFEWLYWRETSGPWLNPLIFRMDIEPMEETGGNVWCPTGTEPERCWGFSEWPKLVMLVHLILWVGW